MTEVVGVRFKKAGKIYYFDPGKEKIESGAHVIVETVRGIEYGTVVHGNKGCNTQGRRHLCQQQNKGKRGIRDMP